MRTIDYQIATLEDGDLFNLLPVIVRTQDGGAVRCLTRLLEHRHNEFVSLYRQLPRLQDPTVAAAFTPADFGEDPVIYSQWKELRLRLSPLSDQEAALMERLAGLVPKSVQARAWEQQVLRMLASSCGSDLPQGPFSGYWRDFIASATVRHRLRGTHSGLYLLSAVLGLVEIKATELWTSYGIKQPGTPQQTGGDELQLTPDEYPLWGKEITTLLERGTTLSSIVSYQTPQVPLGSLGYDPLVQDDGAQVTVTFPRCSPNPASPYSYRGVVNHNNPFGNFVGEVLGVLAPGQYLSMADPVGRGLVLLPYLNRQGVAAFQLSEHVTKQVVMTVQGIGDQVVTITGPSSKVRFKSARFNISYAVDPFEVSRFYLPGLVTSVSDTTPDDATLGRTVPARPVTGSLDGTRVIAGADLKVLNLSGLSETAGVARTFAQSQLPMTREVHEETLGITVKDAFRYAPYLPLARVVLADSAGDRWLMEVDQSGLVLWTPTLSPATRAPVQNDSGTVVEWGVSVIGKFSPVRTLSDRNDVVFVASDTFSGYVYASSGVLVSSRTQGEFITEVVHGDGTPDEVELRELYHEVVENPALHLQGVMSADAFAPVVESGVLFQTRPEDSVRTSPLLRDRLPSAIAANLMRGDEGFSSERAELSLTGRTACTDIRNRYVGIEATQVEPVPSGTALGQDGLTYDYPLQFLNYHGFWYWRKRDTNVAYKSHYLYGSASPLCGGTLVTAVLGGDGPNEGSTTAPLPLEFGQVTDTGCRVSPNDQVTERELTLEWRRELNQTAALLPTRGLVIDASGNARVAALAGEPVGSLFSLVSSSGDYTTFGVFHLGNGELDLTYTANEDVDLFRRRGTLELAGILSVKLQLRSTDTLKASWRLGYTDGSGQHLLRFGQVVPGNQYEASFTLPGGSLQAWIDTSGGRHQVSLSLNVPVGILPTWPELAGSHLFGGGNRDAVEVTLIDPGEHFYTYGALRDSTEPLLSGKKWFRGGNWGVAVPDREERSDLPDVLDDRSSSSSSSLNSSSSSSQSEPSSASSSSSLGNSSSSSSLSSLSSASSNSSSSSHSSSSSSSPSSLSSASSNSSSSSSSPSSNSSASSDSSSSSSFPLTSYSYFQGTGNRTGSITITSNTISGGSGIALVDGNPASGVSLFVAGSAYILFDLAVTRWMDEVRWVQSNTATHGTWRWEGSTNNTVWEVLSASFVLGGATTQLHTLNLVQDPYRYYRLVQISGSVTPASSIREVEFKIDAFPTPDYSSSSSSSPSSNSSASSNSSSSSSESSLEEFLIIGPEPLTLGDGVTCLGLR